MKPIRVWAPLPKKVEVEVDDRRLDMRATLDGWWETVEPVGRSGSRYGFILDGAGPFPDPRSMYQPDGIHGRSQVIDHAEFPWRDAAWKPPPLTNAVIYELHIGTFTPVGNFEAAIEKLPHLVKLGITHVELMPVNEFSGAHGWGYDGVDLFAPHHAYGDPSDLKRLVNACHDHRLAVLLDVVYNHFGPAGNYLAKFGPYFSERYRSTWGQGINFDGEHSHEVRRFFCDNALMWLRDYHFDGLRLDAVHAIVDISAQPFLEQLSREVAQLQSTLGRGLVLIPESDLNDPRLLRPSDAGGMGLDAQWSDDFHHALHTILTEERSGYYQDFGRLMDLGKALKQAFVYDGQYSAHRRRIHGRSVGRMSGHKFIGYLQNHDQIGNRAKGERSSRLITPGRLKVGAAVVLAAPFVPMLFQGEEWGASTPFQYFTDHADGALAEAVRRGRTSEFAAFGWDPTEVPDPQARETFLRSKLNWAELSDDRHSELLEWHIKLIQLRHSEPALSDGRMDKLHFRGDETARWFVISRGSLSIYCNLGQQRVTLATRRTDVLLLASEPGVELRKGIIHLPVDTVAILKS